MYVEFFRGAAVMSSSGLFISALLRSIRVRRGLAFVIFEPYFGEIGAGVQSVRAGGGAATASHDRDQDDGYVILPQALRTWPSAGTQMIVLFKDTSLASIILRGPHKAAQIVNNVRSSVQSTSSSRSSTALHVLMSIVARRSSARGGRLRRAVGDQRAGARAKIDGLGPVVTART